MEVRYGIDILWCMPDVRIVSYHGQVGGASLASVDQGYICFDWGVQRLDIQRLVHSEVAQYALSGPQCGGIGYDGLRVGS